MSSYAFLDYFFFFKQKTAYEMRISDWSSDVCSSDLGTTGYRVLVQHQPEAELMGLFGIVALVVNVAAALVLIPHRTGDANVRAEIGRASCRARVCQYG